MFQNIDRSDSGSVIPRPDYTPPVTTNLPIINYAIPAYYLKSTFRPKSNAELDYAKEKFSSYINKELAEHSTLSNDNLKIRNPYYLSMAFPVYLLEKENIHWTLNTGMPVLGTDITVDLGSQTYVTANLGFLDGEIILQKKVLQNKTIGIAIGGYYRTERRGFEITGNEIGSAIFFEAMYDALSADRIFYNRIAGGRVNGYVSLGNDSFLLIRAAPGYAFNLRKPVINMAITVQLAIN